MNELLNTENETFLFLGIGIATLVIVALGFVVLKQRREIKDLKTPKYGFLGKPLNVFVLGAMLAGGYALFQFTAINAPTDTTNVSANRNIEIELSVTETNPTDNIYTLSALPIVDGLNYGDLELDIYWTVTSQRGESITEIETKVSKENPSDLVLTLPSGNTTINATIFTSSTDFVEKSIIVVVD